MEERSELRRQISEITNSLSVSDRVRSISGYSLWRWLSGSRDTLVRERVSADKLGPACFGHQVSHPTLGPLGQPEKAMGHESRIEPWSPHKTAFCFAGFGTDRLRREEVMKTAGRENPNHWANASSNRAHGEGLTEQLSRMRSRQAFGRLRCLLRIPVLRSTPLRISTAERPRTSPSQPQYLQIALYILGLIWSSRG
jgi:hypothetical protein